jgi:hypothetical protein
MHGGERNAGFERQSKRDRIAIVNLLGDRLCQ